MGREEKRIVPRFPFSLMTFRPLSGKHPVSKVGNISKKGMMLIFGPLEFAFKKGDSLSGELLWRGEKIPLEGQVMWVRSEQAGVQFSSSLSVLSEFLSFSKIASRMRALHDPRAELSLPGNLKYWLTCDAPSQMLFWVHPGGEFKKIQILLFDSFLEWEDEGGPQGKIKVGSIVDQNRLDSPLDPMDEFEVKFHDEIEKSFFQGLRELLQALGSLEKLPLPRQALDFIILKL